MAGFNREAKAHSPPVVGSSHDTSCDLVNSSSRNPEDPKEGRETTEAVGSLYPFS